MQLLRDADTVWVTTRREQAHLTRVGDGIRTVLSALPVPSSNHHGDREVHGLDHEDRVVLHLGRLAPDRGLIRLVGFLSGEQKADALQGPHQR